MTSFAASILCRRAEKSLTQQQTAEMAGISLRQYQELENGRCQPRLDTAIRLAAVLNIDLNLLRDEQPDAQR
jgi:transcriptional regulator with XRE-family HTH domain